MKLKWRENTKRTAKERGSYVPTYNEKGVANDLGYHIEKKLKSQTRGNTSYLISTNSDKIEDPMKCFVRYRAKIEKRRSFYPAFKSPWL